MNTRYLNPIKIWKDFCYSYNIKIREWKVWKRRKKLRNSNFSIFSDNCTAGVICHDLGVQFQQPLINGEFSTEDYLTFLENPNHYLNMDFIYSPVSDETMPNFYQIRKLPIGKFGDIYYCFTHYSQWTENEIRETWTKRKQRINWDNLFVILVQKEGCTMEHMKRF